MIRPYNGAKAQETKYSSNDPLPAGGYVCKIMAAEVKEYTWGDQLVISFDVVEGEYKDFFAQQYRNQSDEWGKKWKGNFRIAIPGDESKDKYFESHSKTFNNLIFAIEDSNHGYNWDWDENKLKGKLIGFLFRNKEWEYMGKTGWTTEACTALAADRIRSQDFKLPKDKPLPSPVKSISSVDNVADDDGDLPF